MLIGFVQKVLTLSTFFFAVNLSPFAAPIQDGCRFTDFHEQVTVARISDGDTLVLTDKRKIRLIGINAPERARYPQKAQAFASEAQALLEKSIKPSMNVSLYFGKQRHDRYKRLLAHVFNDKGENVNALLLENGLAAAIVVPPNDRLSDCYFRLEDEAKQSKKNIWSHAATKSIKVKELAPNQTGFHFVQGKVMRIGRSRGSIWLQLSDKLTIRIKRRDFKYFPNVDLNTIRLEQLQNKTIYARGWIYQRKEALYLQVRHNRMMKMVKE